MKNQNPKEEWARLYMSQSGEDLQKIAERLRKIGYRVITFPVKEQIEPKLQIGRCVYRGLKEIEGKLLKEVRNEKATIKNKT